MSANFFYETSRLRNVTGVVVSQGQNLYRARFGREVGAASGRGVNYNMQL